MRVLVTGASGFLGHAVCNLLSDRGHEAVALVRRSGSEPSNTTPLQGDLTDASALTELVNAAKPDAVIHLAAEIATQRDPQKINEVNVKGTRRLLDACRATDTPRFVFASTVVTGEAHGEVLTEDRPLPVQTAYGRSKQEGERLVKESGLPHSIIRPSHVYGPGGWYAHEIVKRVKQPGAFAVIGSGSNWWDVVYVDDVAGAMVLAAESSSVNGATYHVVDDEPITQYDFVALTAKALGRGAPHKVPAWFASLLAGADPIKAVVRSAKSSNSKIKQELGWVPLYASAREGVPAAIDALSN
jgi:nucleoside-diphosphate-sugar epimerase